MSIRRPRLEFHKAQKIAAALLLVFLFQALWLVAHLPLDMAETRYTLAGEALWSSRPLLSAQSPLIPGDSVFALRCAGLLPSVARNWASSTGQFSIYAAPSRWMVRLPFVVFGTWLGGALWWVARRIFGNEGGYVALSLYCFSPPVLIASASVDSAILASWGLFGLVFTAIGVAHTLYAPPRKWRPRIVLLGVAIGLTAAANLVAAIGGLILAAAFMIYLAPARRLASLAIVVVSSAIGLFFFLLCFGFNLRDIAAAVPAMHSDYFAITSHRLTAFLALPGGLLELIAFVAALIVFLFWKRTRYFGNSAPLLSALLLPWWMGRFSPGSSIVWSLPFAFVFIGGIYADLLHESFFGGRFRNLVVMSAFVLVCASAALNLVVIAGS